MRLAIVLAAGAILTAVLAAGFLTFADTYSSERCEATPGQETQCSSESRTLIEENGKWVLGLLAVPIAFSAGVAAAITYRLPVGVAWSLAILALAACLIAIFSLGAFFLPAALLLIAAAAMDRRGTAAP